MVNIIIAEFCSENLFHNWRFSCNPGFTCTWM